MIMDKSRTINTKIWSDTWFEDLTPSNKLLFIYLLTNEKNNMLGIYEISLKKISFETGIDRSKVDEALKEFERIGKVYRNGEYLIIKNFIKHQSYNSNMKKSAINLYNSLPDDLKNENYLFIEIKPKDNTKDAETQAVSKAFQILHNALGMVSKIEIEIESETEDEIETENKTWRDDFLIYKRNLSDALVEIKKDNDYLQDLQKIYPKLNIIESIIKSIRVYWSTDEGWKNKKAKKSKEIDWKATFRKTIELNKVYL